MRFQRIYRSLLIIPYAVPGFLSLLVWQGLLNDDFGVVNQHLPRCTSPGCSTELGEGLVILVSVWLTFPYFFLVSLGALQSIPAELMEAAKVDGGGPLAGLPAGDAAAAAHRGRAADDRVVRVQLQQLQQHLPADAAARATDQPIAGATDILISYTYKLAFAAGKGNDYGLASAVSIIIFFIVATISAIASRDESPGEHAMSTVEQQPSRDPRAGARDAAAGRSAFARHLVAAPRRLIAVVFALFPVVYVVSAAFNADTRLAARRPVPTHVTLENFSAILTDHVADPGTRATSTRTTCAGS